MAQIKTHSFTVASTPVNEDIDVGFDAARVEVINETGAGSTANPGIVKQADWSDTMANAEARLVKNTNGAATDQMSFITSAGVSMITDTPTYGTSISGFTNANPGVITVADTAAAGFAVGDTIKVAGLADNGTAANSLNGEYTIASLTATTITTATNTSSGYSAYVSGGYVTRVSDANGEAIPTENIAQRKVRIGAGCQGAASDVMHVMIYGKESVV